MLPEIWDCITMLLGVIGGLAFLVSAVTEVTKNIGFLKQIPTDMQVIMLSLIAAVVAVLGYVSYQQILLHWYYIAGAIAMGFLVAFVAMYGWQKFTDLMSRFQKSK